MFRSCDSVFDNEIEHIEQPVRTLWRVGDVDFTGMNRVVAHHATKVKSLLNLNRQPLRDQRADVIVDVPARFAEKRH